jgi:hypothetical protein
MLIIAGVSGMGKSHCLRKISSKLSKLGSDAGVDVMFFKGKSRHFDTTTPFVVWKSIVLSMLTAIASKKKLAGGSSSGSSGGGGGGTNDARINGWKLGLHEALHEIPDLQIVQDASNAVAELLTSTITADDVDSVMAVTEQQDGLARLQKTVELLSMVMQKAIDVLGHGRIVFIMYV